MRIILLLTALYSWRSLPFLLYYPKWRTARRVNYCSESESFEFHPTNPSDRDSDFKPDRTAVITNRSVIKIVLNEEELSERFVKGTGSGGQKINKTKNRVQLTHLPTGISVSYQDARDLYTNRKWARELLIRKLDQHFNGSNSKIEKKHERIRKRKRSSSR